MQFLTVLIAVPTFLYIDPLKQGLKHSCIKSALLYQTEFLYIDPLKQGLKRKNCRTGQELS